MFSIDQKKTSTGCDDGPAACSKRACTLISSGCKSMNASRGRCWGCRNIRWIARSAVDQWIARSAVEQWIARSTVEQWIARSTVEQWIARSTVEQCSG